MKIPFLTRRGQRKQDDALHEPRQGLFHQDFHMFSNDQNIETIAQLVESVKHYASLQGENVKLEVVEKTVRVLTVVAMTAILSLVLMLILIYLSFAAAFALTPLVGSVAAFLIIAGIYLVILLLFLIFRKRWIERPLVHFLASILLSN